MSIHIVVDLVLVLIAVGIIIRSWRRGFVSSVIRFVGTLAAYAGAWLVSGPVAQALYKNFAEPRLVDYAATLVPSELETLVSGFHIAGGNSQMLGALGLGNVSATVAGYLESALAKLGLADLPLGLVDTTQMSRSMTDRVLDGGSTVAQAVADVLLQPVVTTLLRIGAFIVVFAVLSAVVGLLYKVGFGFNHLPLVGGFNHLLGAGAGVLEAAVVLYIVCMALAMASAVLGGKVEWLAWRELQQSYILSSLLKFTPPAGFGIL